MPAIAFIPHADHITKDANAAVLNLTCEGLVIYFSPREMRLMRGTSARAPWPWRPAVRCCCSPARLDRLPGFEPRCRDSTFRGGNLRASRLAAPPIRSDHPGSPRDRKSPGPIDKT